MQPCGPWESFKKQEEDDLKKSHKGTVEEKLMTEY